MTGKEFDQLMKDAGYNQTTLAMRWKLARQTIGNYCKSEEVEPFIADAIKALIYEKQAAEISRVVKLFNNNSENS